jgi:hypothetical protein
MIDVHVLNSVFFGFHLLNLESNSRSIDFNSIIGTLEQAMSKKNPSHLHANYQLVQDEKKKRELYYTLGQDIF